MMDKFALIRAWQSPAIAHSVEKMLRESFPKYRLETIDIAGLLKRRRDILATNLWHVVRDYRWRAVQDGGSAKLYFWRTPYIFRKIKMLASEWLSKEEYAFSFQLQSLFDASRPDLPHFVYTDHTHLANLQYPDFDPKQLYSPAWIALEKSTYQNARLIFTRSSNISRSIIEQYGIPPQKVICVYAGSNTPNQSKNDLRRHLSGRNILFVGVDWERKGGPELAEAFRSVLRVYPDAHLTIVGAAPKMNLPNCKIIGRAPLEKVDDYYAEASIFCLPTKLEPFGIAFVEALAHALPIVATNIGAIPDFVADGQNGYLVSPGDVAGLARALDALLRDAERRRAFGEASLRIARERYTWEKVGKLMRQNVLAALSSPLPASASA